MSNDDREQPRWGERLPEPSQRAEASGASSPDAAQDAPRYGERVEQPPASSSGPQLQYGEQQYGGQQHGEQQHGEQSYGQQSYGQQQYGQQQPGSDRQDPQHGGQQYGQPGQSSGGQNQYGQPQHDQQNQYGQQPQHDQQNQYGQPQHGQPQHFGAAPGYGQQNTQHWDQRNGNRTKQRGTLGVVAGIAGLIALVLGIVGGIVFGNALAGIPGFADAATSGSQDTSQLEQSLQDNPSALGSLLVAVLLGGIGTAFGIWAIIQGIIAAVKNRGRLWGIIAIVLAVLGPIAFGIIYVAVAASSVS